MTLKSLNGICLSVCLLAFLALLGCIDVVSAPGQLSDWLAACGFCHVGSFLGSRWVIKSHDPATVRGQERIGNARFEQVIIGLMLWTPVALSGFAIMVIFYANADFQRVAWVLVALAGNTGLLLARRCDFDRST